MKRLSLVFPPWYTEFKAYKYAAKRVSTFPPLNLCIVGAMAEEAGWEVQLIDAHIEQLDHQGIVSRLREFGPDLIGLTSATPFFHNAVLLARELRRHFSSPVMIGGTHVSIARENAFEDCFDYLFIGECEFSFPAFIRRFGDGDTAPEVAGVMMRRDGKVVYHGDAPLLQDLDKAPPAARHLLPNEKYFMGTLRGRKHYTSVQMSRGCPFSCVFCACDLHGKRFRLRSVGNVMEEIEHCIDRKSVV